MRISKITKIGVIGIAFFVILPFIIGTRAQTNPSGTATNYKMYEGTSYFDYVDLTWYDDDSNMLLEQKIYNTGFLSYKINKLVILFNGFDTSKTFATIKIRISWTPHPAVPELDTPLYLYVKHTNDANYHSKKIVKSGFNHIDVPNGKVKQIKLLHYSLPYEHPSGVSVWYDLDYIQFLE